MVYFGDHDDFHQTVIDTERDQANSHVDFGSVSCGHFNSQNNQNNQKKEGAHHYCHQFKQFSW